MLLLSCCSRWGFPPFFITMEQKLVTNKTKIIREEMLQVADTVAREKNIEKAIVFEAMEEALQKVARSKYGQGRDIRVSIDKETGDIELNSYRQVVEKINKDE